MDHHHRAADRDSASMPHALKPPTRAFEIANSKFQSCPNFHRKRSKSSSNHVSWETERPFHSEGNRPHSPRFQSTYGGNLPGMKFHPYQRKVCSRNPHWFGKRRAWHSSRCNHQNHHVSFHSASFWLGTNPNSWHAGHHPLPPIHGDVLLFYTQVQTKAPSPSPRSPWNISTAPLPCQANGVQVRYVLTSWVGPPK